MNNKTISAIRIVLIFVLLYACGGNKNKPVTEPAPVPGVSGELAPGAINGEEVYKKSCIACHQANGEGIANIFPPLAKSDFLSDKAQVIDQVIKGKTGEITVNGVKYNGSMPPQDLSDEEISAVLSYIYSSWGNTGESISVDEVKSVRSKKI